MGNLKLNVKNEEDRELLKALPQIAAALLLQLAAAPTHVVIVFSTRGPTPQTRVLTMLDDLLDPELLRATRGAPALPRLRLVALRKDGTYICRDMKSDEITDREETAPA